MKKETKAIYKFIIMCVVCCALLVSGGYFYLNKNITETDNTVSKVPYTFKEPENSGILVEIAGNFSFWYMDFENSRLAVMLVSENDAEKEEIYGYTVDYRLQADYTMLADIIDFAGGIETEENGTKVRLTGIQAADKLSRMSDGEVFRRHIITSLISSAAQNGFQRKYIMYIIKNSETDLTVPDCYVWSDYIKKLCVNGEIIN